MTVTPLAFPSSPDGIRTFRGYCRDGLDRQGFLRELGSTFMPGTPLMQAPLGLWAYLPAVLDLSERHADYPDEVAIIVYLSRAVYDAKRESSLSRRMYTHSHRAVFDMQRSGGQFPTPICQTSDAAPSQGADAWYLFDEPVDWQDGHTRIAFVVSSSTDADFPAALRASVCAAKTALHQSGCDQIVGLATPAYAALWMHWPAQDPHTISVLNMLPAGTHIERDLLCERAIVRGDDDTGVQITGPAAFSFIFSRDLRYLGGETR
jgi:hypothetical protein